MQNKFKAVLICMSISASLTAQTVVTQQNEKVKGENVDGFSTEIEGKANKVAFQWNKFLKEIGKVKLFSSNPAVVTEPNLGGTVYLKGIVYAHIFNSEKKTRVWLGLLKKEWEEKEFDVANNQLEKLVYRFGIQYSRSLVQDHIDQTNQSAQTVERLRQRLVNQSKELTIQLGNNEKEKVHLQKSIAANALENEVLKVKIEKNKKAQDSLATVFDQIKKVAEGHQEEMKKIN